MQRLKSCASPVETPRHRQWKPCEPVVENLWKLVPGRVAPVTIRRRSSPSDSIRGDLFHLEVMPAGESPDGDGSPSAPSRSTLPDSDGGSRRGPLTSSL